MVYVVLRNGKVIQYNDGDRICVEDGTITVRATEAKHPIARLPLDTVERAEFRRPCAVLREGPARKRKPYRS
jgi:hypothetical protein